MDHEDAFVGDLEPATCRRDRLAAIVHKGGWLEQHDVMWPDMSLAHMGLESPFAKGDTVCPRELVKASKAHIVAVFGVNPPGIASS